MRFVVLAVPAFLAACAATSENAASTSDEVHLGTPPDAGIEASTSTVDDGAPDHRPCTSTFGHGIPGHYHGRLDGYLVAIVPPTPSHTCGGDRDHLHLQIAMQGATYDVAVNIDSDVLFAEADAPLADGPWLEGWKPSGTYFDIPSSLGLHSADFDSVGDLSARVEALLANVNHISVFATPYASSGIHLVHRNGHGNDGAIILNPLSSRPHYLVFRFPSQVF